MMMRIIIIIALHVSAKKTLFREPVRFITQKQIPE